MRGSPDGQHGPGAGLVCRKEESAGMVAKGERGEVPMRHVLPNLT